MPLPQSCAACTMFQPNGALCRRHAPSPTTAKLEPAKWPKREPTSRCAEGNVEKPPIACQDCFFWWPEPNGQPLTPSRVERAGIWASRSDDGWWKHSGLCVHHTGAPGAESVLLHPRVTHGALDGCGAGKTMEEVLGEAG